MIELQRSSNPFSSPRSYIKVSTVAHYMHVLSLTEHVYTGILLKLGMHGHDMLMCFSLAGQLPRRLASCVLRLTTSRV